MTKPRYAAGFEHGARCGWTDVFPPGVVPIVDRRSGFAFGQAIAFAENRQAADLIVAALNQGGGKIKRWAVISLDDNAASPRQGYAYLYPERPENPTEIGGIGTTAAACIEIEFAEGDGLGPLTSTK